MRTRVAVEKMVFGGLALALAVASVPAAAGPPPIVAGGRYVVNEARSLVRVHVGKSGVLSFAGHRHEIAAPVAGSITADATRLEASTVELVFATPRFRVLTEGEPEGDAPKVEAVMHGPRVLDSGRYGDVRFVSRGVTGRCAGPGAGGRCELRVNGELTIRGVTREVTVPMSATLDGVTLSAKGRSAIRHDEFGLVPVTAGAGTVRVRNEIEIDFEIVAERNR